jgi:hypothetical protein
LKPEFTTGSRGEVPGKKENLWQEMMIIIIIIIIIQCMRRICAVKVSKIYFASLLKGQTYMRSALATDAPPALLHTCYG